MKLIIGLGNPGIKYDKTRHNLGFRIIDELILLNNLQKLIYNKKLNALISENILGNKKIILAKPQTFMNNSGQSVKSLVKSYSSTGKFKTEDLIVIHDDIDLPLGEIRFQKNRGSAGHRGVQSIINSLETKNFTRVRCGIRPNLENEKLNIEKFVLEKFSDSEEKTICLIIKKVANTILATI